MRVCGGTYVKTKEPDKPKKRKAVTTPAVEAGQRTLTAFVQKQKKKPKTNLSELDDVVCLDSSDDEMKVSSAPSAPSTAQMPAGLETLVGMGFNREEAAAALASVSTIEAAVTILSGNVQ